MNVIDRPGDFKLQNCSVSQEQVHNVVPDHGTVVANHHAMLLRDHEPGSARLMHQGVFIDFLEKSSPQSAHDRQGATNDLFGQSIKPVLTGTYLRVRRALRFHFPYLPARGFRFVNTGGPSRA